MCRKIFVSAILLIAATVIQAEMTQEAEVLVKISNAELERMDVSPDPIEFNSIGALRRVKVTGIFKDGTTADLSGDTYGTEYFSDAPGVAETDVKGKVRSVAEGMAVLRVSNEGIYTDVDVKVELPYLVDLTVKPVRANLMVDNHLKIRVVGEFSDGSTRNISGFKDGTSYETSDEAVAEINKNGVVRALAEGNTAITVENAGLTGTVAVYVKNKNMPLIGIDAEESVILTKKGEVHRLKVTGTLADKTEIDISSPSTGTDYTGSNPAVAEIGPGANIKAVSDGQAFVEVANAGFTDMVNVEVNLARLVDMEVSVVKPKLTMKEEKTRIKVTGIYSDGSRMDISGSSFGTKYVSDNPSVASVNPEGIVTAGDDGIAVITVSNGSIYKTVANEVNIDR